MSVLRVSAIMPVRNMAELLPASVQSILDQSRAADEILIVDDGSTDDTPEVLDRLAARNSKIQVIRGKGERPSAARNSALDRATGDVVAFLDADDLWPAGKLELQLARLERPPAVDAVWGKVRWFDRQHPEALRPADDARIVDVFGVNLGAGLVRRTVFDRVGLLDVSLIFSEDVDFVLRMRDSGVPITVLPAVTLYYRRHGLAMTAQLSPQEQNDFRKVVLRSAARRGGGALSPAGVLADLVEQQESVPPVASA
jgi:glycosyltransferase involved in cell wall biosynthesis